MIVLGINPGPASTGLAVVTFAAHYPPRLVLQHTVYRAPTTTAPLPVPLPYLEEIWGVVDTLEDIDVIGVPDLPQPAPAVLTVGPTDPDPDTDHALACSIVAQYCMGFGKRGHVVAIPPADIGTNMLGNYPCTMVSETERRNPHWRTTTGAGHAPLRHVRAAYDVAHHAHTTTQKDKQAG